MTKKKLFTVGLAVLSSVSLLAFTACKKNTQQAESTEQSEQVEAIESTSGIEYELSKDGTYYVITNYTGTAKKVVCGDTHKNLPVKEIGDNAFYNTNVEMLTISDSIEKIGEYAFFNCDYLTTIDFGNGLKEIGEYSFSACKSLTQVILPEGLERIENSAFYSSNVINVSIPESINYIGINVFDGCESLQYSRYDNAYYLGNSDNKYVALIYLGEESTVLTKVDGIDIETTIVGSPIETSCSVHSDTRVIGGGAFENHAFLNSVAISKNVTAIGDLAFSGCANLSSVILSASVESIGVSAFAYCSSLRNINLPENLVSLGDGAFSHCSRLSIIHIPDSVTEIAPFTFNDCSELTFASMGAGVKSIGAYAFNNCFTLSSISFKNYYSSKLESIGAFAFNGCYNLSTVMLPASLKIVEEKAFVDTLRTIYAFHSKASWVENGFDDNPALKPFSASTYLYSEARPDLNTEKTDYDRKYFFVTAEGNKRVWEYKTFVYGIECTYSANQPDLNQDGSAYDGDYFFYNVNGVAIRWEYIKTISGTTCTYSKNEPALNGDSSDYDGDYFYYDDLGVARKWIYNG